MFIGITGRGRSGKDTSAGIILQRLNEKLAAEFRDQEPFTMAAFMDPFKEHLGALFGLSHAQTYGNLKQVVDERWGVTPRYILQYVVTDQLRARWPDIVHLGPVSPFKRKEATQHCLITDVRIPSEVEVLHNLKGVLVRVERPGLSEDIGGIKGHATEKDIDDLDADIIIVNDGTLGDLRSKARDAADALYRRYKTWRVEYGPDQP